jgi:glutathione synthase
MKFLFIGDPLSLLKPKTDTSLALIVESLQRKHRCSWATPENLVFESGKLKVKHAPIVGAKLGELPAAGPETHSKLADFSVVWIRKDPPFDSQYLSLCWLLSLEEHKTLMVNRPSLLIRYHEKLIPWHALALGYLTLQDLVPTHIGDAATAKGFLDKGKWEEAIRKPFFGFGGAEVQRFPWGPSEELPLSSELQLTQPFLPEIQTAGDRRVFFIGGKVVGDFVRLPGNGQHVSNIARGGSGHLVPMTAKQKHLVQRLGRFLKKVGIAFAGADVIGNRLSEVNITSPTGVRTYDGLSGINLAPKILDYVERSAP